MDDYHADWNSFVHVLERFFNKGPGGGDADHVARPSPRHRRMRNLPLTRVAETKVDAGDGLFGAKNTSNPLQCVMEEEEMISGP